MRQKKKEKKEELEKWTNIVVVKNFAVEKLKGGVLCGRKRGGKTFFKLFLESRPVLKSKFERNAFPDEKDGRKGKIEAKGRRGGPKMAHAGGQVEG